ncbi:hypothetical protein LWI29_024022 [Acer saccharum]|uniref:pyruvate kinase n=1 Tax=Acer saccharum TaxID=4024 RepID=A0AA39TGZ9_ACESA|nr:hypothetical protein LWI29_024022 [Acer saccharum]
MHGRFNTTTRRLSARSSNSAKDEDSVHFGACFEVGGDGREALEGWHEKLAEDLNPGSVILSSDGTITLTVLACDKELGLVRCCCENSAVLGERKDVNLTGVIVDLPTSTEKDKEDILQWGVPNKIDMIALSFVRKGSDLVEVRKLLGKHAKTILLMSKVENQEGYKRPIYKESQW